jgi:hypothetical protein
MEDRSLRLLINREAGGKILSLFHKDSGYEWLIQNDFPGHPLPAEGEDFHQCCMFGWEEMFPTLLPCLYPAHGKYFENPLPDHGELWFQPWSMKRKGRGVIQSVQCAAYKMGFTREVRLRGNGGLDLLYEIENRDTERLYYFWAPHPFFRVREGDSIVFPPGIDKVINVFPDDEFGGAGELIPWRGKQVAGTALGKRRKVFWLPGREGNCAALINHAESRSLSLSWDERENPYFACVIDEGLSHTEARVSFEPMNGRFDTLESAFQNGTARWVDPGEKRHWSLHIEVRG